MNLFQPWRDIPELTSLAPKDQKRCWKWFEGYWRIHAMHTSPVTRRFISFIVGWAVIVVVIGTVIRNQTVIPAGVRDLVGLIFFVVATVPVVVVRTWMINRSLRRWLCDLLHRDYEGRLFPICIRCGYPLIGCLDDVTMCPECGNDEIRGNPTPEALDRIERPDDFLKL